MADGLRRSLFAELLQPAVPSPTTTVGTVIACWQLPFRVLSLHVKLLSSILRLSLFYSSATSHLLSLRENLIPFSPSAIMYKPIMSSAEYVENYKPGGLHPVHLGDIFNKRYRVCRKLGFGSWSTVWLARDLSSVNIAANPPNHSPYTKRPTVKTVT